MGGLVAEMGHERVLNEDKVAHPDEGMVGIMREIERSRPSRAQGMSFDSPGRISEWLLGCGLSGLGFEVRKVQRAPFDAMALSDLPS